MKILLCYLAPFIDRMGGGEKVCCTMANELTARGHAVSIMYRYGKSGRPLYPLDPKVHMYNLMSIHPDKWFGAMDVRLPAGRKIIREILRIFSINVAHGWQEDYDGKMLKDDIRHVVKEVNPDVIISNWPKDSNLLINYARIKTPVVTMFHFNADILAKDMSKGSGLACCHSAAVQVLLKRDIPIVKKYAPAAHVYWIPNAVSQCDMTIKRKEKSKYTIIHVGRLDKNSKRQHMIIEAFSLLAAQYPQWQVELWGPDWNTSYKRELETLIEKKNLRNRVFLKGVSQHVQEEEAAADLFAWPSLHEGFGLAMAEAMSAGLPVVACKACAASVELLSPKSGILVDEGAEAFAKGLEILMSDPNKRMAMGRAAKEEMKAFAPKKVWDTWEQLLVHVVQQREDKEMADR